MGCVSNYISSTLNKLRVFGKVVAIVPDSLLDQLGVPFAEMHGVAVCRESCDVFLAVSAETVAGLVQVAADPFRVVQIGENSHKTLVWDIAFARCFLGSVTDLADCTEPTFLFERQLLGRLETGQTLEAGTAR